MRNSQIRLTNQLCAKEDFTQEDIFVRGNGLADFIMNNVLNV